MGITGAGPGSGTTISPLFTAFPGTLVYDFPVTDFYIVQLFVSLTGLFPLSTWSVTCGPSPRAVPLREFGIPHVLLCSPTLAMRADGTMGHAFEVELQRHGRPRRRTSLPVPSLPATTRGYGLDCSNLPGYTDAGRKTDGLGTDFGSLASIVEGAVYPYFRKS